MHKVEIAFGLERVCAPCEGDFLDCREEPYVQYQ